MIPLFVSKILKRGFANGEVLIIRDDSARGITVEILSCGVAQQKLQERLGAESPTEPTKKFNGIVIVKAKGSPKKK